MTLARTPYARLSPADIGQVDRELKKLEQMTAGLYVPKVLVAARSPYTVQGTDTMLLCDCTAGAITLTFPLAARVDGMTVQVMKSDTSANAVTLSGTFSGVASPTLTVQDSGFTIMAMNGAYHVTAFVPYPIVTGETGVTSIVYAYGDVRRYGAKLDGVTNDRAAFVAADASATLGIGGVSRVIQPTGTALIGSNLTLVNPFRPYPGAKVRPANAVVVTMNGSIHAGLYQWIDTSVGGKVVFAKGSVVSIHPQWWGPVSTFATTMTAMLAALNTGTTAWNPRVRMPSSDYTVSASVTAPNSLANVEFVGDGNRSTRLLWTSGVAGPIVKFTNARNVHWRDVGFVNSGVTPTYDIQYDSVTAGKTATPMYTRHNDCFFGGDSSNSATVGIGYTSSDGSDQNNEQGKCYDCEFYNCVTGISYAHSNALWHKVVDCDFTGCTSAVSNYVAGGFGGGFTWIGSNATLCDRVFEIGPSRYPIQVFGGNGESNGYLIYTPATITQGDGGMAIYGGLWFVDSAKGLKWDSSVAGTLCRLTLEDVMMIGGAGCSLDFPGTDPVYIRRGSYNFPSSATAIKYAGLLYVDDLFQFANLQAFSTAYNSTARIVSRTPQASSVSNIVLGTPDASLIVDLRGIPNDSVVLASYGAATTINNFRGGYDGYRVTILATNGNTTIHRGAGIFLTGGGIGSADFVMATSSTLTILSQGGNWYEVGRKT